MTCKAWFAPFFSPLLPSWVLLDRGVHVLVYKLLNWFSTLTAHNRNFKPDFFDVIATHNDQITYVKCGCFLAIGCHRRGE